MRLCTAFGVSALATLILATAIAPPRAAAQADDEPLETAAETGPVKAIVRLSPTAPVIGDPLILELEVHAQPGVELLMPEFGDALDRFPIVDFSHSEKSADDGGTISLQRYTLAPSRSGDQAIPSLLIEFVDRRPGRTPAPENEDAYELLTEALAFEVGSALEGDAPFELRPSLGSLGPRKEPGLSPWTWLLIALAGLAVATPFGLRAWASWRSRSRRVSAYEVAKNDLDALVMAPRPSEGEMDGFFVRLSGIIRLYLEDRFGLRSPELTTEEFLDQLAQSPDLVRSHQQLLRDFLNRADLVKFAHLVPAPEDVEQSLDGARRFLELTRGDTAAGGGALRA
jgi:hypothetical protein